ncbi:hemagglutinin [Agrobacterium larrymoorei]|uniref:peptidoglycan-binding protein n=1 Tax=Agrobacterium larrymoorei TaxID=160699 RepID=UPI0015732B9F|nr:peptidoglycan-binding protein [Agrobacterium larrymoorei]NTJ41302.1 hemagglutinin [Agrobacterium larrymoorei]
MSGLRSNSQRPNDRSSLDALNRTIEGLEARIEDLLGGKPSRAQPQERPPEHHSEPLLPQKRHSRDADSLRFDPIDEIRKRQQALDERWEREQVEPARSYRTSAREDERRYEERDYRSSTAIPSPRTRVASSLERQRPAPSAAPAQSDTALREVAEALVNMRQELKHEISEGVAREMQGLRAELRNIRSFAENQDFAEDIREDVARLASSIERLGKSSSPGSDGLRVEFEQLRALVDQMAREDSVHRIESRWESVEDTLRGFDTAPLQEEIVALAYRLDDIKSQLGTMSNSPAVRALEEKLITIAGFVEQLGRHIQPNDRILSEHFSGLDERLDEITRAIAAAGNRPQSTDNVLAERLENRLNGLSRQLDALKDATQAHDKPSEALTTRLDALANRIEELSSERSVSKLGERLDQLSLLLEKSQRSSSNPELNAFLTDISKKIDQLGAGAVNEKLAERLEKIARRIEDIEARPAPTKSASYDSAFLRLEERLGKIAAKLDETTRAGQTDTGSLAGLETQIANLSLILNEKGQHDTIGMPPELDQRMAAIEDYMSSNDEYIIEAARQAAEAVLEAHMRNNLSQTSSAADTAVLVGLADDLRKLEGLSRNTEERTHRTFEALHETLVQIAGRLDALDNRNAPTRHEEEAAPANHARMPAASYPDEGLISQETLFASQAELPRTGADDVAVDTIVPPAAATPAKAEKRSLLSSLTRRFKSSAARADEAPVVEAARAQVSPAPALDPVDVLSADDDNELLEPGSGAPDVKKILERVRASQNAAARAGSPEGDSRADFIAAARRAAQAAAQETLPEKASGARASKEASAVIGGSALARYRRPLLLGIGAILLAMMAMPMVKNYIGSEPSQIAPAASTATPPSVEPTATPAASEASALTPAVTIPSEVAIDEREQAAADRMQADADRNQHLIDTRPIGGAPLPEEAPAVQVPAPSHGSDVAEPLQPTTIEAEIRQAEADQPVQPAPVQPVAEAPAENLVVPASITPASLAQAAAKGDRLALFEIGVRYTDGVGVAADRAEAAKWYKLSADRGLAVAQYRLGNMYEKANGVERNLPEAKRYYEMAARQGNAGAMHNLAVLLTSDAAGQPDFKAAADWFIQASDLGVRDSQFNLAILYARGSGVQQSLEESYKWFAIAARDGDTDAEQKREDVAKAMKPEQLASAKAKVEAWKVKPLNEDANSVNPPAEWTGGQGVTTASVDMQKAIRNIQAILNNNGFKAGTPDGKLGRNTVAAIKEFQKSVGQAPDGRITDELVTALLARNK